MLAVEIANYLLYFSAFSQTRYKAINQSIIRKKTFQFLIKKAKKRKLLDLSFFSTLGHLWYKDILSFCYTNRFRIALLSVRLSILLPVLILQVIIFATFWWNLIYQLVLAQERILKLFGSDHSFDQFQCTSSF